MRRQLPIFPLNTVLFPGASLPLQIFEPRYRQMLQHCLDNDRRFGVSLIRAGVEVGGNADPFEVGAVARIDHLGEPARGALPLLTHGESRYRIVTLDRSRPYLIAEVDVLEDHLSADPPLDVAEAALAGVKAYLAVLFASQGAWQSGLEPPRDPLELSYFIGAVAVTAANRSRQRLLEADSVGERLQAGIALLEEETRKLERTIMRSGPGEAESRFGRN